MTSRAALVCAITALSLALPGTASAQRWGHERVPQAGACFYENINFGGQYFCVRAGEQVPSLGRGMNDRISSIRTFGGAAVTVFRDANMRGSTLRFGGDVRDLRRSGWNDRISSIVVERMGMRRPEERREGRVIPERGPVWGHEAEPREGACFYRDPNFRGEYFCVARGESYASLPRGFNDSIRSIRLFGAGVRIFFDSNYRGRSTDLRRSTADMRGIWRDNISSIQVY